MFAGRDEFFTTDFTDSADKMQGTQGIICGIREIRGKFFGCGFAALCLLCLFVDRFDLVKV